MSSELVVSKNVELSTEALISRAYEVIREYLRNRGIEPTPKKSRIAFGDDPARHTSPYLGGTAGNDSPIERVAYVNVWNVNGFVIQAIVYDVDFRSTQPLLDLIEYVLQSEKWRAHTDRGTEAVIDNVTAEQFADFLDEVEALGKSRQLVGGGARPQLTEGRVA